MKQIILLILLGSLSACANKQTFYIDPQFVQYVQTFESTSGIPVRISINFANLSNNYAGLCYRGSQNRIEIDIEYWNESSSDAREQVLFHELGHCVLGLDHDDRRGTVGRYSNAPLSIMNSYAFGHWSVYTENKQYYIEELIW